MKRLVVCAEGPDAPVDLLAHLSRACPGQRDGAHDRTPAKDTSPSG